MTHDRRRAGCPDLFKAIAIARPAIHCFGHIHEGWGAKLAAWRPEIISGLMKQPSHFNAIDNGNSFMIERLAGLQSSRFETVEDVKQRGAKIQKMDEEGCFTIDQSVEGMANFRKGEHTLFLNAAMEGDDDSLCQKPFFVELDLPES
jgi:hypothetical protein